jgi:hypothetical protein
MSRWIGNSLLEAWRAWERFWFETDNGPQMRLFRLVVGLLLFVVYVTRGIDLEVYFSERGIAPVGILSEINPGGVTYAYLAIFKSTTVMWALHGLFLTSLLALAFGIFPRISSIVAMGVHVMFIHRNMAVAYGVDLIAAFFLLYFCLMDHRPGRTVARDGVDLQSMLGSAVFRLSQIQVCIIYAYSGLQKLQGGSWWRGDALWLVLANHQLVSNDYTWLAHFPTFLMVSTYLTLAWEIYFPVTVWVRQVRYPTLVFGVLMHLGIAATINIHFFALLMIFTYLLFLEDAHAQWIELAVHRGVKKVFTRVKVRRAATEEYSV